MKLEKACDYRGASMGRRNILPDNPAATGKLSLRKLRWYDGDYDEGGAYWGNCRDGASIWHAYGDLDGEEFTTRVFVRAKTRAEAALAVQALVPGARIRK